jgi:cephalosporin hydroxylase
MPMDMRTNRLTPEQWAIVDQFHELSYRTPSFWRGVPILKWVGDIQIYQELIWAVQPETLIECGTAWGGSAMLFASIMDMVGKGRVISIDTNNDQPTLDPWIFPNLKVHQLLRDLPEHERITYLTGDTTASNTIRQVKRLARGTTMVVLDSNHNARHVLKECRLYANFVTVGSYLVVEDIDINGHPVPVYMGDQGPYDAAFVFMQRNKHFKWHVELTEKYLMSSNAWMIRQD